MTDERLRQLEREAATGDVEAKAKLLLERVRVGELSEDKLRLAAYLGDEACAGLNLPPPRLVHVPETGLRGLESAGMHDLAEWAISLLTWGEEAPIRASIAAVHSAARGQPTYVSDPIGNLLATLESALLAPQVISQEDLFAALRALSQDEEFWALRFACDRLYDAIAVHVFDYDGGVAAEGATTRTQALQQILALVYSSLGLFRVDSSQIEAAIREELIPWALGERDPVRERVEARRGGA